MRVLVTGGGPSGSWTIRGEQLGTAIGATILRDAPIEEMQRHDLVVVVKRIHPEMAEALRTCGRPVVWDCVDFYPQPNVCGRGELIAKAQVYAARMGVTHVIAATKKMARDLAPAKFLPHHGWERGINPIRQNFKTLVYEGSPRYIEGTFWQDLNRLCAKWRVDFVVNPSDYLVADVVIALRSPPWLDYGARFWKSGVKLSNAQITGTPFIGGPEMGCREQESGGEAWVMNVTKLETVIPHLLDYFGSPKVRQRAQVAMLDKAPRLSQVAREYREILEEIVETADVRR